MSTRGLLHGQCLDFMRIGRIPVLRNGCETTKDRPASVLPGPIPLHGDIGFASAESFGGISSREFDLGGGIEQQAVIDVLVKVVGCRSDDVAKPGGMNGGCCAVARRRHDIAVADNDASRPAHLNVGYRELDDPWLCRDPVSNDPVPVFEAARYLDALTFTQQAVRVAGHAGFRGQFDSEGRHPQRRPLPTFHHQPFSHDLIYSPGEKQ